MKIAITGSAGFLGRRLKKAALQEGHEVLGLDCRPGPGDTLLDLKKVSEELKETLIQFDLMIHCAAQLFGDPMAIHQVNVLGTQSLIKVCPDLRFVLISSMSIFETVKGAYAQSKAEAEALVKRSCNNYTIIRPTMIYGRNDPGWTAQIRRKIQKTIFLPNGGETRIQPLFVEDAARFILKAGLSEKAQGQTFGIGGPAPLTQREFFEKAGETLGVPVKIRSLPLWPFLLLGKVNKQIRAMAAFHQSDHLVDISPAQKILGFDPIPVDQGLPKTFL